MFAFLTIYIKTNLNLRLFQSIHKPSKQYFSRIYVNTYTRTWMSDAHFFNAT
jgi:hypothetical protein